MTKHTRVLGIFMAAMMAVSTAAMVPVNAANTTDYGWAFSFKNDVFHQHKYSYSDARTKQNTTSVYVYFQKGDSNYMHLQTMGRQNGGGWNNCTLKSNVYLAKGNQYSVQNNIYEALKLNSSDTVQAALRGNADGMKAFLDASGVWSPDSARTYIVV